MQTGFARRPADATRSFTQATPKFGAVYALTPTTTLVGSYRRGFRVPTEAQLFKQGSSSNTIDLKPVNVDSVEAGIRTTIARRTQLDATVYYMRLTDDILSYRALDGVSAATNKGQSRHRGVEIAVDTALTPELRLNVGYAYATHTFDRWQPSAALDFSGRTMDGAPSHQRNAQLTYIPAYLRGGRLHLEWTDIGDYWLDPRNALRQDGYDVFHLRGSIVVAKRYEVYARLMNVFDTLYAAQGFMGDTRAERYLNPGEYRTLYAGLAARF